MLATHFLTISVRESDLPRGGRPCSGGLAPTLWPVEAGAEMDRSRGTPAPVKKNKHKTDWVGVTRSRCLLFWATTGSILCQRNPVHSFTPIKHIQKLNNYQKTHTCLNQTCLNKIDISPHGLGKDFDVASSYFM
jgi:hypothetical protein